jgi:hypothetical protein
MSQKCHERKCILLNRSLGSNARPSCDKHGAIALTAEHLKKRRYQFFPSGTYVEISAFVCITGDTVMASKAGVFFAGVGTTFIILGAGFGGGLMMATSGLKEPTGFQNRASAGPPSPVRVILPYTAEAAQPPEPSQQIALRQNRHRYSQ